MVEEKVVEALIAGGLLQEEERGRNLERESERGERESFWRVFRERKGRREREMVWLDQGGECGGGLGGGVGVVEFFRDENRVFRERSENK